MSDMLSPLQRDHTGPEEYEFAPGGVYAMRLLYLDKLSKSLIGHWGQRWPDGEFTARCLREQMLGEDEARELYGPEISAWPTYNPGLSTVPPDELKFRVADRVIVTTKDGISARTLVSYSYHVRNPCDGSSFDNCTCGFYGTYDPRVIEQWRAAEPEELIVRSDVFAVVQHYGKTVLGERGLRSRKARLVAAVYNYDAEYRDILGENYPSVRLFDNPADLLDAYPVVPPV